MIAALISMTITISPLEAAYATAQQSDGNNNSNPIKHITIMQENHTFDNYFGTYPGANGIPKDICMPLNPNQSDTGCVRPFLTTNIFPPDMPHEYQPSHIAYDNGKMDGFMVAENQNNGTMSYYNNNTIPHYWDLAKHYVLADNFYSSVLSYSLPNRWYAIAGQAPISSIYYSMPQNPKTASADEKQASKYYLPASNAISTIADSFVNNTTTNNNTISWKYYYHSIDPVDNTYIEPPNGN
jgi:phospholipase C